MAQLSHPASQGVPPRLPPQYIDTLAEAGAGCIIHDTAHRGITIGQLDGSRWDPEGREVVREEWEPSGTDTKKVADWVSGGCGVRGLYSAAVEAAVAAAMAAVVVGPVAAPVGHVCVRAAAGASTLESLQQHLSTLQRTLL